MSRHVSNPSTANFNFSELSDFMDNFNSMFSPGSQWDPSKHKTDSKKELLTSFEEAKENAKTAAKASKAKDKKNEKDKDSKDSSSTGTCSQLNCCANVPL